MPEPIANFSAETVIDSIEQNMVDSSVALGRTEDGVVFRGSDVTWVYTGYPSLNRVLRARFSPDGAEDRVAEIADCFQQWDARVLWIIGPSSWPTQLPEYLNNSGFGMFEQWTGMAADLRLLPDEKSLPESAANLRIEQVTDARQLKHWAQLSSEGWHTQSQDSAINIFSPENAGGDARCRYYLGYIDDEPVIRGQACISGESVGLYWVATKPKHTQLGYDIALATRALTDARDSGAKLAVMTVSTANHPICEQIGFQPYCHFSVFEWPKSRPRMHVS